MHSSASDPLIGIQVGGLFEIEAPIGRGASSRVYRARHLGLHQRVAIKVLHHEYVGTEGIRARFHREARVASRIAHPAVVSVLMSGELPNDGITRGEAFIVYEYVDGMTLRQILDAEGRLSVGVTIGILVSVGEAVGAAHELGIVHRDIKPENLMVMRTEEGHRQLRVLDFGLARIYDNGESPLTHTGAILGTPSYLAPEGARGQRATPSSDVYSIATVGYECLSGAPPFHEASPIRVLMQQIEREPPALTLASGLPTIPSAVLNVIYANLSKLPEARAANAWLFARDLRRIAAEAGVAFEDFGVSSALWQDSGPKALP